MAPLSPTNIDSTQAPAAAVPSNPQRTSRSGLRQTLATLAKKIVPRTLIQEVRRYRRFSRTERPIYVKVRLASELGLPASRRQIPNTARSFVFVCFGNIMRSPMSEALFRASAAPYSNLNLEIVSAGLNATEGTPAHPWAISAAKEFGISLDAHRATLLTRTMIDRADAVIAMDYQNQVEFLSRHPDVADKFFLLGTYADKDSRPIEIRDPFYGDQAETLRCYRLLQTCTQNLADNLFSSREATPKSAAGAESR